MHGYTGIILCFREQLVQEENKEIKVSKEIQALKEIQDLKD